MAPRGKKRKHWLAVGAPLHSSRSSRRQSPLNPPPLPVELVRLIFELAASYRPTALSLCTVSKDVNSWITPIVYRTVLISKYPAFKAKLPSHPDLIKNLCIPDYFRTINLEECSALTNLALDTTVLLSLHDIPTSVTHLSIEQSGIGYSHPSPLPSITHLFLYQCRSPTSTLDWCTSAQFPNLTHMVLEMNCAPDHVHVPLIVRKLAETGSHTLRVVGLRIVWHQDLSRPFRLLDERLESAIQASLFPRDKIVVLPGRTVSYTDMLWKIWLRWVEGGEDIWNTAERLLAIKFDKSCHHDMY